MGAGASGEGGHPDFGMSGVSVPGSSGFGEQRGFGNNVSAIGLATNPSLQHDIAHVQLGYNVPGYTEMDDNPQRAAMIDGMRHAMGVRALDQAGLSPSLAGLAMDAREMMSDQQERDFQNNAATASFLDANPNAGIGDIAAAIGSASQGYGNPHGFAVESPLDMSMAMASTEDDPWGVNPQQVMDTSLKAIALKAAKELSKKLGIGVAVPGLPVLEGLNIGKKALDAVPDLLGVNDPTFGIDTGGRKGFGGWEPSMDLQMQGIDSIFDGVDVQALDNAILGLDNAFASTDNDFGNYSGISPSFDTDALSRAGGDPRLAEAQRLAAQLLAQQAAASVIGNIDFTPEEVKIINTPPANTTPGTTPGTTPPGTTPPGTTPPGTTTPPDDSVSDDPPGRGNRPNPIVKKRKAIRKKIATATKAKLNPKGLSRLPKFAQEALKRGIRPDTGSDYVQDQISQFLNPPKPIDYSNPENRGR